MVTLNTHSSTGVNVLSVGVISGSTAADTNNARILNQYASDGVSLYFPPGEYYIDASVKYNGHTNVKVWGDGARIYQRSDTERMFDFVNCNKVEVSGLTLHTFYFRNRTSASGSEATSAIYCDSCELLRIHHNLIEGFQCNVVRVRGGADIHISDNTFKDGHWTPDAGGPRENTACIKLGLATGTQERAREVIISNNNCNTKALIAISNQYPTRKLVVTGNNCIAKDENDVPIEGYAADAPKAGIEVQYYADAANGLTGDDNEDYDQIIIANNNVQGCRFSGITGQSSQRANAIHPGIRGLIANNTIKHCGTETGNVTTNLVGGLNWIGYRDLVITGNVITNIPNSTTSTNGSNALLLHNEWARVDGSGDSSTPTSAIVNGNIISNCAARGIYITVKTGDINICNNIVQDIDSNAMMRVVVPAGTYRAGHIICNGNKFAQTKTVGLYGVRFEAGTTRPAEITVSNNVFNFQDATFTTQRAILDVVPEKAVITGNRITGAGANSTGLDLRTLTNNKRFDEMIIADNQIENCAIGVGSSTSATFGPFLLTNCTLTNCTTPIEYPKSVWHGYWANGKAVMFTDLDPSVTLNNPDGTYLTGDLFWNTGIISSGVPMGWACTATGTPNTYTPLAQVP